MSVSRMNFFRFFFFVFLFLLVSNAHAGRAVLVSTEATQSWDRITLAWDIYWGNAPVEVCYYNPLSDSSNPMYYCESDPAGFLCGAAGSQVACTNDDVDTANTVVGTYTYPSYGEEGYFWPDSNGGGDYDFTVSICTKEDIETDETDPRIALGIEGCEDNFYTVTKTITLTEPVVEGDEGDVEEVDMDAITQTSASGVRNSDDAVNVIADYDSYDINYNLAESDKKVVAYWGDWSVYGRSFDLDMVNVGNYTHIAYSFMGICNDASIEEIEASTDPSIREFGGNFQNFPCKGLLNENEAIGGGSVEDAVAKADGTLLIPDIWAALQKNINDRQTELPYPGDTEEDITMDNVRGVFEQLIQAKERNSNLKVLASIGGWTQSTPFADVAGDETKKQVFIDSLKAFLTKWTLFDGIDIDWEFPRSDAEGELYVELIKSVREALDELEIENGKDYELSSAVFTPKQHVDRVDYREAIQYMDFLFAMNYDYHGAWESDIGFHTNLFGVDNIENSVNQAMKNFIEAGVPKEKLLIGVGAYGRSKKLDSVDDIDFTDGVLSGDSTADSYAGPGTWENGVLEWYDQYQYFWAHRQDDEGNIVGADDTITIDEVEYNAKSYNNYYYLTDPVRNADFLVNPVANTFTDIESPRTAYNKAKYANLNDLAGVFFWVLEYDNGLITNAIHEGLETEETSNPNNIDMDSLIAAFGANTDEDSLTQVTGNELDEAEVDLPGEVLSRPEGTANGSFGHTQGFLDHGNSRAIFYVTRDASIGPTRAIWDRNGYTTLTVPVIDEQGNDEVAYLKAARLLVTTSKVKQMNSGIYQYRGDRRARFTIRYNPEDNLHLTAGMRYRTTVEEPLLIDAWYYWRMDGEPLETFTYSLDFTVYDSGIDVDDDGSVDESMLENGLRGEYFSPVTWDRLGAFPDRIADVQRLEPTLDYASTTGAWSGLPYVNNYVSRYTGYLTVPSSGRYVFSLESGDGSRMSLSDEEIILNDGVHGMRIVSSETIQLEAGKYYPVSIEYFERSGAQGLRLFYQSSTSNGNRVIVPSSMLSTEEVLECTASSDDTDE